MARILFTSGPTRQYLDPVRYLTNASSGRMGLALVEAALAAGHEAVVVSGPVEITYPPAARIIPVLTTDEMLAAARDEFPHCDGLIGVAAPCDYKPTKVEDHKIAKTGEPLTLQLIETLSDIGADRLLVQAEDGEDRAERSLGLVSREREEPASGEEGGHEEREEDPRDESAQRG